MQAATLESPAPTVSAPRPVTDRYAKCIEASKRIRWDIDRDVIRGRSSTSAASSCPTALSHVRELPFLRPSEARFFSQVQGRTYANLFGMVERFIGAKTLELTQPLLARRPGGARGARPLRRRGAQAPGDVPPPRGDGGARDAVRLHVRPPAERGRERPCSASRRWAVLALDARHRDLHAGALPRRASSPTTSSPTLWKDVFLFHWKEESQHAILDELEWRREHARCTRGRARPRRRRPDRPGRRGRRHPAGAGACGCGLLRQACRARVPERARRRRSATRCSRRTAGSTSSSACRSRATSRCSARW